MIAKLPRWVWFGGFSLSFLAGIINAVGFLGIAHAAVTHLTGSTTLSAIALSQGDFALAAHWSAVIGSYFFGAVVSGVLIKHAALQLGQRYGSVLVIESIFLFLAIPLLSEGHQVGDYFASAACGLQNGMASSYSGAVVRTTHVSGIVTDLGIATGHFLRGAIVDIRKFKLHATLLTGFFSGGVLGGLCFASISYRTLYIPALVTGFAGILYTFYAVTHQDEG